jgi:hypothetical protein
LLAGFRLGLRALIRRWTKAGRFRRRIAVVAVSDFSHEFIERLQAEPDAFEIAGVYDDRLRFGRVSSVYANVPVRGSVIELVRDSREAADKASLTERSQTRCSLEFVCLPVTFDTIPIHETLLSVGL